MKLGGLSCIVTDMLPEGSSPRLMVVMCHGFGAPGSDLVPLAAELVNLQPALADAAQFVFPAAPLSLDQYGMYGGRAWWPIDIEGLNRAIQLGEFRDLRAELPPELPESRRMLTELIGALQQQTGLSTSRFVLGGFSQGSMLATDVALRLPESPGGLGILSGTLLCESEWRELAASRRGMRVFQSHGLQDPLLPFQAAEWLRDLLTESGLQVDFLPFQGMHTIPLPAMERFADLLQQAANG